VPGAGEALDGDLRQGAVERLRLGWAWTTKTFTVVVRGTSNDGQAGSAGAGCRFIHTTPVASIVCRR